MSIIILPDLKKSFAVGMPILIKEDIPKYTKHDQLFKQLIGIYFEEFLEAFFPYIHERINFEKITFLSEEVLTEVYDGDKSILDLVVEAGLKETDALVVVHIEPQSYYQKDFNKRMFKYFSLLYNKIEIPIIPIAVFSYKEGWNRSKFHIHFSDLEVMRFNYWTLHLKQQNWRNFIKDENPVSAALLSKMGYSEDERVYVKLEFFKILTKLKLNKEKTDFLLGFFEAYLKLNEEEEEVFVKEAKKLENAEEILELPISYEERGKKIGREEGLQEGLQEGLLEGRKEVALEMLREGLNVELIMKTTKLSLDDIQQLKKRLQ